MSAASCVLLLVYSTTDIVPSHSWTFDLLNVKGNLQLFVFFDACYWHSDWRDFSGIAVSPSCSWKYSIEQSVPSWSQTFQKQAWKSSLVSQSCQSQMLVWKSEKMSNTVWVMAVSPWEPLCLCQYFARDTGSEAFGQSISHTVYLPLSPLQSGVFVFW